MNRRMGMNPKFKIALSFATEEQKLVEKVYHYLKAENISVFFAPSSECQALLSGENQREVFYSIFGMKSEYVALFVSKNYIVKDVPMEEANIAFSKHSSDGKVIPIYLDGTPLPPDMFDPRSTNYFKSDNPAAIASHLSAKIKYTDFIYKETDSSITSENTMNVSGNTAKKQIFIQQLNGNIDL